MRRVEEAAGFSNVSRLLAPRSVAVVGASDQPGNVGGAAIRFFVKFSSPCTVYPVNPGRDSVAGLRCYASLADLPELVDLAIIAVPAAAVIGVVRDCIAAGIAAGVVWAGGFVEGGPEGLARQQELTDVCRLGGFALLGPNCLGIIDAHAPVTASFASMMLGCDRLTPGNISVVSQSGGLATMAVALAQREGYGFRYMISTGNEAVLGVADFIYSLVSDDATKLIAVYVEGVGDGRKFRNALLAARTVGKPVIVLKAGATSASAAAAAAHTGALAGEARVWDAILRDAAAIQVYSLEELLDVALQLSGADLGKLPKRRGVASVTFGGGSGVLSADQCDRVGLAVPELTAETRAALTGKLPPIASTRNPVDLTPQAFLDPSWLEHFPAALDLIAADPSIGTVFFQLGPMSRGDAELADMVTEFRSRCPKPVVAAWPLIVDAARARLLTAGVHVFPEYSRAVRTIGLLANYAEAMRASRKVPPKVDFDWSAALPPMAAGTVVPEHACHALLARAGLPVPAGRLAQTEDDGVAAASAVGFPVALKGIAAAITHRAKVGLLELDLADEQRFRIAWRSLQARAMEIPVVLDGLYVQAMSAGPGTELLVSAFRDPEFGVIISLGAGGTLTEILNDVVLAPAPFGLAAATALLNRLRVIQRAGGINSEMRALPEFVTRFASLAATAPWQRFVLEVNPVKWSGDAVIALDGLLIVETP